MPELPVQDPDQGLLTSRRYGERRVTTLARDHDRAGCSGNEAGHSESRAGTEECHGCAGCGGIGAYEAGIRRREVRQAPSGRFLVVDDAHIRDPEFTAQTGSVSDPGRVGERAATVLDRPGYCEDRRIDRGSTVCAAEEEFESICHRWMGADIQRPNRPQVITMLHGEPGIGPADIGKEDSSHCTAPACSDRINCAYQRAEALGMRRKVG